MASYQKTQAVRVVLCYCSETSWHYSSSSGVRDDDKAINSLPAPGDKPHCHLRAQFAQVPALSSPQEHAGVRPRDSLALAHCQAFKPPYAPQQADSHCPLLLAQVRWCADAAHVWRAWVRAILPWITHRAERPWRTVNIAEELKSLTRREGIYFSLEDFGCYWSHEFMRMLN